MQRGKSLENYLDNICRNLNNLGWHAHKNQVRRSYSGLYLEGEPFDYEIFAKNEIHVFDAKENYSGGNYWRFRQAGSYSASARQKMLNQTLNLVHCKKTSEIVKAYFLVYFGHQRSAVCGKLISFDADIILDKLVKGESRVHYSEGVEWSLENIKL